MSKIVVLVSGGGSNLQSIIDAVEAGTLNCEISAVISDRPAGGLDRAEKAGIKNYLVDRKENKGKLFVEIDKIIDEDTDLIVLAGFLSIISGDFIKKWENKIINIHPSLLPKFGGKGMYGMNVHKAVVANKETESGCTVHYVTVGIDEGEIIAQRKVAVSPTDTPEMVAKNVLVEEHKLIVEAVGQVVDSK